MFKKGDNMDEIGQTQFDEELRQREIKRLTSPLVYKKERLSTKVYDIEGNEIPVTQKIDNEYVLEPKQGILSDDEILKYAYKSKVAAEVRLKRGINDINDKKLLYGDEILMYWLLTILVAGPLLIGWGLIFHYICLIIFIIILAILIYYTAYVLFLKDYTSQTYKTKPQIENEKIRTKAVDKKEEVELTPIINSQTLKRYEKQVNDLRQLYEVKEKIAIDMIGKRFSPTELTYDRFMSTLKSCTNLFYEEADSTLNIINFATDNTPKVEYEIKNRLDILKLIIEKADELTNELVLNMSSLDSDSDEIRYLVEDMEKLIESVKDYK